MRLRWLKYFLPIGVFAAGVGLPPQTISRDVAGLLITFLGLVAASILPTISIILGGMNASTRSVKALKELRSESLDAINALFFLFGMVGVSVLILISLSIPTPELVLYKPLISESMQRAGQAAIVLLCFVVIWRSMTIPNIIRRALEVRFQMSVNEARRRTLENAPDSDIIGQAFKRKADFGATVKAEDLRSRRPH